MTCPKFLSIVISLLAFVCCSSSEPDSKKPGPGTDPEPNPPTPTTGEFVYMQNGKLYSPQGEELALWGVNLQPCISWEYNDRLKKRGIQQTASALKQVAENNLDEVKRLGVSVIRCHLTPGDFTDSEGNLVESSPYLDVLDYMITGAAEREIYMTFAFINDMGSRYISNSMWSTLDREEWIHNQEAVEKSKNYITQLLKHTNKYNGVKYADEPWIATWELINEPAVYSYSDIKSHSTYYEIFKTWAKANGQQDNSAAYEAYRQNLIKDYIDGMYLTVRDAGAQQPIIWSHNWHRYRNGNLDVFKGALASKADAVSCCNYPGQDLVSQDYWANPKDLTSQDYSGWFNQYFDDVNGYGWLTLPDYNSKAKTVYEFETFFNQSAYLYPIQAQYFRALGVQMATMWTYTMQEYSQYFAGSHFLSLTCTPKKAASFMVAHEIFKNTALGTTYDRLVNEQIGTNFVISKNHDLSIFSSADKAYYSGDLTNWCPITLSDEVKHVMGVGNSSLVSYSGTGIYFLDEENGELFVTLEPNHKWLGEPWNSLQSGKVTSLDYDTKNTLSINLKEWKDGSYTLYKIENDARTKVETLNGLQNISIAPGDYVIVRE